MLIPRPHSILLALAILAVVPLVHATPEIALKQRGAEIYKQMCISCHGDQGQGVSGKYDEPIHGTRTLDSLAKRIDRTMPEDDPDLLDEEGARAVAAYIYDAFYSPSAQARNNPERQSLSRLTVAQYQNSVLDIFSRFRGGNDRPKPEERGLKARYKVVKGMGRDGGFDRIDSKIDFNFGNSTPDPEKLNGEGFSISWNGALLAPETGHYEFILKSENGISLWLNSNREPTIDGAIASGETVREEKKTVFLIGGRSYPIRVEYLSYKQPKSSVQLMWKTPHGVQEVIPAHYFYKNSGAERMVVTTTFPADDRSDGYERGTTISKEWDRATTNAAIEVVTHVEKYLDWLAGTKADQPDRVDKLKKFAHAFAEAAFRRPLSDEQKKIFVDLQFEGAPTPEIAVKRVVLLSLKSPRFLYPDLKLNNSDKPDGYDIATRLALAMWDSVPDTNLLKMAAEGKLTDPRQVAAQASRMLDDPRSKNKLHGFFHHWLELERAELANKDAKLFPGFDNTMLAALRESLLTFIDQTVWSDQSDYRQLINADYLMLDERLARYYGKNDLKGGEYQRVSFDPNQRAGIITHPYLLASFAYNKTTSPIHRGVFLTRNIVGMTLKSPPIAVAFEDSKFDPTLTMREKVIELTKDTSCMGCHSSINPLGFALENFDAVGRWRTQDNNKPVDPTGEFDTEDGKTLKLKGPRDIAVYAANSPAAHRAFIRQLFHHFNKQPAGAYGQDTVEFLRQTFSDQTFNIKKLIANAVFIHASQGLPEARQVIAQSKPAQPKPTDPQPKPTAAAAAPTKPATPAPTPPPAATPQKNPSEKPQKPPVVVTKADPPKSPPPPQTQTQPPASKPPEPAKPQATPTPAPAPAPTPSTTPAKP
ncbi:DUF1592 domain-containing protein [Phragmitibacter flavus]|uniref:DUF1592 domain-containing protein n=1 Tax=Phragmitibacter flavus TaxID=2576071 RepID=UPI001981632C|nr:DUF1592 domain-containing protein [Phragmitibacter flavus]